MLGQSIKHTCFLQDCLARAQAHDQVLQTLRSIVYVCCGLEIIQQAPYVVRNAALLRSKPRHTDRRRALPKQRPGFVLCTTIMRWLPLKLTLTASSMLPKGTTTPRGVANRPEDLPSASSSPHVAALAPQVSGFASGRLISVQLDTWPHAREDHLLNRVRIANYFDHGCKR